MGLNRIYGILYALMEIVRASHLLDFWSAESEDRLLLCTGMQFSIKFVTLCFWSNHIIIAMIRYIFVIFPIETHNRYPSKEDKNNLFNYLVRYENCMCIRNWNLKFSFSFLLPILLSVLDQVSIHVFHAAPLYYHVCLGDDNSEGFEVRNCHHMSNNVSYINTEFSTKWWSVYPLIFIGPIKSETCLLKLHSLQSPCVPYPHHLL